MAGKNIKFELIKRNKCFEADRKRRFMPFYDQDGWMVRGQTDYLFTLQPLVTLLVLLKFWLIM